MVFISVQSGEYLGLAYRQKSVVYEYQVSTQYSVYCAARILLYRQESGVYK